MIGGESFVNEELSALRIAIFVIIQLNLSGNIPRSRVLLVLLVQLIEGKPLVDTKTLVLIPTLAELCQVIAESYGKEYSFGSIENNCRNTKFVNGILFRIIDSLWRIETADDLHHLVKDTFDAIDETHKITTIGESKVSLRSPIGRYVQRIAVSVKLLHFNETTILFNCIRQFREPTLKLYKKLQELGFSFCDPSPNGDERVSSPLFPTWTMLARADLKSRQTLLTSGDSALFQKLRSSCGQSVHLPTAGSISSINLQFTHSDFESLVTTQISLLERYGTPTPESLRLAFKSMASLCATSRIASTSSVHYLDYLENLNSGDYREAFNSLHQYFDYMVSKGSKYFYHFALISKASLHQFFGEDRKALDSIEEAISVARENKDNATLTYVLSWLFDFMRKKPSLWDNQSFHQIRNQLRLLDFLIKKSQSVSLLLAAVSFRFETELLMNCSGSFLQYYESLFKATYISIHDSIPSFIGLCHTSSTLWQNVGNRYLSTLYSELGSSYSENHGTTQDHLEFELRKYRNYNAMGLQSISTEGLNSKLSTSGTNIAQFKILRYQTLLIQTEIELHRGRLRIASELLSSIPDDCELEPDFIVCKLRLAAMILTAQGNSSSALLLLNPWDSSLSLQGNLMSPNIIHVIKLNYLKAHILISSGSPDAAFFLVIQHLELARKKGFNSLVAEGFSLLLRILNETDNPHDAHFIALVAIPAVVCVKDLTLMSSILFETAKSCCAMLELGLSNPEARNAFGQFLHCLSLSISGFKNLRNLHMLDQCFKLEHRVTSIVQLNSDIRNTEAFEELRIHSFEGLGVIKNRLDAECSHGYLNKGLCKDLV